MRQEWDERARVKARYYIATDVPDNESEFFASGEADYEAHARAFLRQKQFDPAGKTALEIGCGIGRMTRCLAAEFGEAIGIDISAEMVERARKYGWPRARFVVGTGAGLEGIESESIDFVFSFIVFQHIPDRNIILRYIEEVGRVLRQGGLFRVQLNGLPYVRIGGNVWEGYISQSPKLRRVGLKKLPFVRRRRLGTWLGHPVSVGEVREACRRGGLQLTDVNGRWKGEMWVGGAKGLK